MSCSLSGKGTAIRDLQVSVPTLDTYVIGSEGSIRTRQVLTWSSRFLGLFFSLRLGWPSAAVGYFYPPLEGVLPLADEELLLREPHHSFASFEPMEKDSASQGEAASVAAGAPAEAPTKAFFQLVLPSNMSWVRYFQLDQFRTLWRELTGLVKGTNLRHPLLPRTCLLGQTVLPVWPTTLGSR